MDDVDNVDGVDSIKGSYCLTDKKLDTTGIKVYIVVCPGPQALALSIFFWRDPK